MSMSSDPIRGALPGARGWRNAAVSGNMFGVASMLTWAAGFPAAEILLQTWTPLSLIAARLVLAVSVLVPIWIWLDGPRRVMSANWPAALWIGGAGFGAGTYFLLLAQSLTDAVTVALIASCGPLVAALLELAARSRRLSWNFCFGVVASIAGGWIATSAVAPAQLGLGAFCVVIATVCFMWGSMMTVRKYPDLSDTGRAAITLFGAMVSISGIWGLGHVAGLDLLPKTRINTEQVGMLLIYAWVAMALSQVLFVASVGRLGVTIASFHMNIAPFYVMVIMVMLGAAWNWSQAIGAAVVAFGVILAQRPNRSVGSELG